jgi:hypothetical protein
MAVVNVRVTELHLPIVFALSYLETASSPCETLFWNCMYSRNWKMETIVCSARTWAPGAITGEATPCSVIDEGGGRSFMRVLTSVGGSVPIVSCHCPHTIALSNYIVCDSLMSTTVPVIRPHRLPFICMHKGFLEIVFWPKTEISWISYLTASEDFFFFGKELDLSLNLRHRLVVLFRLLRSQTR